MYFSTCLFVISCNFANISLHWPSISIKLLAILFTFVVLARRLDSDCTTLLFLAVSFTTFGILLHWNSFLRLVICLWWKRERINKVFFRSFGDAFNTILNCSSALTLAHALYWKDAWQVPVSECFFLGFLLPFGLFKPTLRWVTSMFLCGSFSLGCLCGDVLIWLTGLHGSVFTFEKPWSHLNF